VWMRPTGVYRPRTGGQVAKFQRKHGLTVDRVYGQKTHAKAVSLRLYDAYAAWLFSRAPTKTPEEKRLAVMMAATMLGYNLRAQTGYSQGWERWSGISQRILPPRVPPFEDCSSGFTYLGWVAHTLAGGTPDPNGLGWTAGWTGSLAMHGRLTSTYRSTEAGYVGAFYRSFPHAHITLALTDGRCWSMGSMAGPSIYPTPHYRGDLQVMRVYPF
jgi:peptidoglycan hydrolase-like protein with peptidoglycan-binding domain